MTDFQAWNMTTHPIVRLENDYNNILDHGLEKAVTYIIRIDGGYYEAIQGGTSSDAGTIAYGGVDNAGSVSGTSAPAVFNAVSGTVYVDAGTYLGDGTKITPNDNTHFIGKDRETTIIKLDDSIIGGGAGGDGDLLYIYGGDHISFSNILFDHNHANNAGSQTAVYIRESTHVNFYHCYFKNFYTYGLMYSGYNAGDASDFNQYCTVRDCYFDPVLTNTDDMVTFVVYDGKFLYNTIVNIAAFNGFVIYECDRGLVQGNTLRVVGATACAALAVWSCRYTIVTENQIEGVGNNAVGIDIRKEFDNAGARTSYYNQVVNNTITTVSVGMQAENTDNDLWALNRVEDADGAGFNFDFTQAVTVATNQRLLKNVYTNMGAATVSNTVNAVYTRDDRVENSGSVTVTGVGPETVTHRLGATPTNIQLTVLGGDAGHVWADTIGAVSFNIHTLNPRIYGTGSITVVGVGPETVTHGMGGTPDVILLTGSGATGDVTVSNAGAVTFDIDKENAGTHAVYWAAFIDPTTVNHTVYWVAGYQVAETT